MSRSVVMSPNMSPRKYREANVLNAQLLGIPSAIQESLIRSKREMDLAKNCVQYLKSQIESAAVPLSSVSEKEFRYNNPVWIPYADILGQTLPANRGTEKGKWYEFLLHVNWSRTSRGSVEGIVKVNGDVVGNPSTVPIGGLLPINYHGPTLNPNPDENNDAQVYLKQGLYRMSMITRPQSIFHDGTEFVFCQAGYDKIFNPTNNTCIGDTINSHSGELYLQH